MDLAKLESGSLTITFELINLGDVARWVTNTFEPQAQSKGVKIVYQEAEDVGESLCVMGDGDRLQQVLTNYIDNALRHTDLGGTVTLSVDSTETR